MGCRYMEKENIMEEDKYHRIGDVSIREAVDRCIKVYGFEGMEDKIKEIYTHPDLKQLKEMFLVELYRRWK